jgi:Berberine and berberine like
MTSSWRRRREPRRRPATDAASHRRPRSARGHGRASRPKRDDRRGLRPLSIADLGEQDGQEIVAQLTGDLKPVHSELRTVHYPELQNSYTRLPFGLRSYWSGRFLASLPDDVLDPDDRDVHRAGCDGWSPIRVAPRRTRTRESRGDCVHRPGGTLGRDVHQRLARPGRGRAAGRGRTDVLTRARAWAVGGGYLNYASEASADGLASDFGAERFRRLREVKRAVDPGNIFRFNHNISPD